MSTDVLALRKRYWANGYRPVAIWNPEVRIVNAGKRPVGKGWQDAARMTPPRDAVNAPNPQALNTGILCDEVRAVDVDVLEPSVVEEIIGSVESKLGSSLVRIGRAPKAAIVYRALNPFNKIETSEFTLGQGKAQVEILARGQQFVADGTHPETMLPYTWKNGTPEAVPITDLPTISQAQAREIASLAEQVIRSAGGVPLKAKRSGKKGVGFFAKINQAALENIMLWAPMLFPKGRAESTGAWRVSSASLGRGLEEDISVHPAGVQDFGEEEGLTPIDLIVRHGGKTSAEAGLWLCEMLGLDPLTLGWTAAPTPDLVERFNTQYSVVNEAGKIWVVEQKDDQSLQRKVLVRYAFADFRRMFMNRSVALIGANGRSSTTDEGSYWLEHKDRRQYLGGVVFEPKEQVPGDCWNLWTGFAISPKEGDWHLLHKHIDEVVCSGIERDRNYLLNTIARLIQQPHLPAEVAVVLRAGEGAGKGALCVPLRRIWGQHGIHITSARQLVGNFNSHLRDCVYMFADEAFFAGDRQHEGVLKALITEPTIPIEGKYQNVVMVRNMLHMWMSSNNDWVVPASHDARRYFLPVVSETKVGERGYFKALWEEINGDGLAALLHAMLRRDISKFEHRDVPQTTALAGQRRLSLDSVDAWWLAVLDRGFVWVSQHGIAEFGAWMEFVATDLLFQSYQQQQRGGWPASREMVTQRLSELYTAKRPNGPHIVGEVAHPGQFSSGVYMRDRPRGFEVGTLDLARARFAKKHSFAEGRWDDKDDEAPVVCADEERDPF
jgi:hypothetical protein